MCVRLSRSCACIRELKLYRARCVCGLCTLERINAAEAEHIKLHGVSEGKEYVDDL